MGIGSMVCDGIWGLWLDEFPWDTERAAIDHLCCSALAVLLDCRPDAQQYPWKCFSPPVLWLVTFESTFQLPVKSLNQPIGLGVVGSGSETAPVRGNCGRCAKPGYPSLQECSSHCLCCNVWQGKGFWPASKPVDHSQ